MRRPVAVLALLALTACATTPETQALQAACSGGDARACADVAALQQEARQNAGLLIQSFSQGYANAAPTYTPPLRTSCNTLAGTTYCETR